MEKNKWVLSVLDLIKILCIPLLALCLGMDPVYGQHEAPRIYTEDIIRFWEAYDALEEAASTEDSIRLIQTLYLDQASEGFRRFIKARELTAEKYVQQIAHAPKFWESVREKTLDIKTYIPAIEEQYVQFRSALKGFKNPPICFAIGVLSTGGTVQKGWLLIGTEMVVADSTVHKEELNSWLKAVLPDHAQVLEFTAHELVHTQQRFGMGAMWGHLNHRLLSMSIHEGAADFLTQKVTGATINKSMYAYGYENEEALWKEFSQEMYGKDFSNWLYNGTGSTDRPADLGYFMGYRICESYYENAKNKEKALNKILKTNRYRRFLKKSGYMEKF
ncbi:gliding motility protein GldB-related protein [Pararhodonellum marinum]|uniref:gliding motility protein GldB-related protein n=1 Tax=Pararhodonellum marinum TaxID=2755358 RepID=UPI00188E77D5|nr:DUF2268 domain-containing putative Zn-dependent protease [Pararhodonellum marinum]